MTVPCAGADANVSELDPVPDTVYALVFCESDGYCITPSNATKILSLLTTALDKVNVVVLPSAVKVSTLLSVISNVGKLFATRFPKITSEEEGFSIEYELENQNTSSQWIDLNTTSSVITIQILSAYPGEEVNGAEPFAECSIQEITFYGRG